MSDLRNKLIRLAHKNPEIRGEVLPLLKEAKQLRMPIKVGNAHIRYRVEDNGARLMVLISYRVWNSTVLASALIKDLEVFEKEAIKVATGLGKLFDRQKMGSQTQNPAFVRVELGASGTKHPLLSRHTSYYVIDAGMEAKVRHVLENYFGASEIR